MTATDTLSSAVLELNSSCVCLDEDNKEFDCYGDCFTDNADYLNDYVIPSWITNNKVFAKDYVRIEGINLGWTHASGYTIVEPKGILEALKINGDFRIEFRLKGGELSARRWSHDEPTGAYFLFSFADEEN